MKKILFNFLILLTISVSSSFATTVKPVNIRELVNLADTIIKVTVIDKQVEYDDEDFGGYVTYYTFQVKEWIKGEPTEDNELVIKQIGQGKFTLNGYNITRNFYFPEYKVGKTYLLFLPEAHPGTGLLAPIGLQQGVFQIKEVNGEETIPSLKKRMNLLKRNLPQNNSKNLKLLIQNKKVNNNSYKYFKQMIDAAGE